MRDLGIEEPGTGLVRADGAAGLPGPAPGGRLKGPALLELAQDRGASCGLAIQATPAPPAGVSLLLSIAGLGALGAGAMASQFPGSGGWQAIQSWRDVPDRAPSGLSVGHETSAFKGEVMIEDSPANTLAKSFARCCTSFVSLGSPSVMPDIFNLPLPFPTFAIGNPTSFLPGLFLH